MRFPRVLFLLMLALLPAWSQAEDMSQYEQARYLERVAAWETRLEGLEYVPDEVIVEFEDARSLSSLDAAVFEGFRISQVFQYRPVAVFRIHAPETLPQALARLEGRVGIRSVGPNLIRHCAFSPNDALYDRQQYLVPIHSEMAWDMTTGSPAVKVAVIDTGLDVEHPEFAGRVIWRENFYDPDKQGAGNVFDDSGHGTAVVGVVTAAGNNDIGIAGIGWNFSIMAYRACGGPDLQCTISNEVQAIDSAVAHGVEVINLSLGGIGTNSLETEAIRDAYKAGAVIVAASGNGNPGQLFEFSGDPAQDKANMYYPASFPEVIGVAALDNSNGSVTDPAGLTRALFSNYGEDLVSVAAVGTSIQTTVPYRPKSEVPYAIYLAPNYARLTGTSFACPQVAGLAGLVLSKYPTVSPLEVRNVIEATAREMGGPDADQNGVDDYLGYGLIDAGLALGVPAGGEGIFSNSDFLAGVTPSPLFAGDVFIVVRCKQGCDEAPAVTFFVQSTGDSGEVDMEPLPAHPNTFLGRLHTSATGSITFQVTGFLGGSPLETLEIVYLLLH